jgi:hypothetical protein
MEQQIACSVADCDGLEDFPSAHTIGNANHFAPGLPGRAGDKLQGQGLSAACYGDRSKCDLHFFKELLLLRLRKTNDQPGEAGQWRVSVAGLQGHSPQKIRTDHLQAVPSRIVAPKHQRSRFERLLDYKKLATVRLEIENLPRLGLFPGQVLRDSRPAWNDIHGVELG